MTLRSVCIENYRSIETVRLEFPSQVSIASLIGVNESGKSSILEGVSLFETKTVDYPSCFHDNTKPIQVKFSYYLTNEESEQLSAEIISLFETELPISEKTFEHDKDIEITVTFAPTASNEAVVTEQVKWKNNIVEGLTWDNSKQKIVESEGDQFLDLNELQTLKFNDFFWLKSHSVNFWKANSKYLLNEPVSLAAFAADPKISIPLLNSFGLAQINDIPSVIEKLTDSASIVNLENKLSDAVTKHITTVWKKHPVNISFNINNSSISFLIEDTDVKYNAKSIEQRSDGFRQFVSFLLSVSAENHVDEQGPTIFLLDEPETHLHPQAQKNLLDELISLSKNSGQIVLFATHSNYFIDKRSKVQNLEVTKKYGNTLIRSIDKNFSSFAEVAFEIFGIPSNDYHNELYGYLERNHKEVLRAFPKTQKWKNERTRKTDTVSRQDYIRHSIHHPENTQNRKFAESQLNKSILEMQDAISKQK